MIVRRKVGERVRIRVGGVDVWLTLTSVGPSKAGLGIHVPAGVEVLREELIDRQSTTPHGQRGSKG